MRDTWSKCSKIVKENAAGLQFDKSAVWHHKRCGKVEDQVYQILKRKKDMIWFYSTCNPKIRRYLKEVEKYKELKAEMKKEFP